jgi:hypothetical protein
MAFLVNGYREGLTTTVVYCVNDRDIKLLRMLRQVMGARHSCSPSQHLHYGTQEENNHTSRSSTNNQNLLLSIFTLSVSGRHIGGW